MGDPRDIQNHIAAVLGLNDLLVLDHANEQVSVGYPAVTPAAITLYANRIETDPAPFTSETAAIQSRLDYQSTGDTASNATGVYGTLWVNSPHTYSGGMVAVRGNAYTIAQAGNAPVNVSTYMAGGIFRSRHQAAGTVAQAIGVLADGAQNAGTGTITKSMSVLVVGSAAATSNFGVYFNNTPNTGHIATNAGVSLTFAPEETLSATLKVAGLELVGYVKTAAKTVSGLTAAATAGAGARDFVTDATATLAAGLGNIVVGSGGNKTPVYSDGTNWRIG